MASIKNGPNGPFSGKVGSVVGSSWLDIDYIRSLPKPRQSPPTKDEAANRNKFGFTQKWLNHFASFISIGYMNYSRRMTAHNAALSWNHKNAIKGTAPNLTVDYSSVLLSDGPLQQASNPGIQVVAENKIEIKWEVIYKRKAKTTDELMFIAFCPELGQSFLSIGDAVRSEKKYEMEFPEIFKARNVETYLAFCSVDRKISSRTQYLGNVTLLPAS